MTEAAPSGSRAASAGRFWPRHTALRCCDLNELHTRPRGWERPWLPGVCPPLAAQPPGAPVSSSGFMPPPHWKCQLSSPEASVPGLGRGTGPHGTRMQTSSLPPSLKHWARI